VLVNADRLSPLMEATQIALHDQRGGLLQPHDASDLGEPREVVSVSLQGAGRAVSYAAVEKKRFDGPRQVSIGFRGRF